MKKLIMLMLTVMVVAMMNFVSAADVDVINTKCYPDVRDDWESYDRGQTLGSYIKMSSKTDLKDVQVKMSFSGYEYGKLESKTGLFDMDKDTTYIKKLSLNIPKNMEPGKYHLRFQVTDKNSLSKTCYVPYNIVAKRNLVEIKDNNVQQSTTVQAGGFLQVKSLVKNTGQKEQDWMKVVLEVPQLGISDAKYFTNVEADDSVEFDGLLRIPSSAKTDNYFAKLKVIYYDGDSSVYKTIPFMVKENTPTTTVSKVASTQILPAKTSTTASPASSLLKIVLPVVLIVLVFIAIVTGAIVLFRR